MKNEFVIALKNYKVNANVYAEVNVFDQYNPFYIFYKKNLIKLVA